MATIPMLDRHNLDACSDDGEETAADNSVVILRLFASANPVAQHSAKQRTQPKVRRSWRAHVLSTVVMTVKAVNMHVIASSTPPTESSGGNGFGGETDDMEATRLVCTGAVLQTKCRVWALKSVGSRPAVVDPGTLINDGRGRPSSSIDVHPENSNVEIRPIVKVSLWSLGKATEPVDTDARPCRRWEIIRLHGHIAYSHPMWYGTGIIRVSGEAMSVHLFQRAHLHITLPIQRPCQSCKKGQMRLGHAVRSRCIARQCFRSSSCHRCRCCRSLLTYDG